MLHLIWYIIVGLIAGVIAKSAMHMHMSFVWTVALGIVVSTQAQHQSTHWIRGTAAIIEQLVPILIARDALILFESADEIGEEVFRELILLDSTFQGYKDRMMYAAGIHGFELRAPPGQ